MLDAARLFSIAPSECSRHEPDEAMIAAHEAKWIAKETLEKVMWSTGEICGSTALIRQSPIGAILSRHALAHDAWPPRYCRPNCRRVRIGRDYDTNRGSLAAVSPIETAAFQSFTTFQLSPALCRIGGRGNCAATTSISI